MATVVLTDQANDDLVNIFEFIALRNPSHAAKLVHRLATSLHILQAMPLLGRPGAGGKRELLLGKRSEAYIARYRYADDLDTVFVLAIESQRRN
jgi:plasmid stabilization system protein ParE